LLRRQLQFHIIVSIHISSLVLSIVVSIVMAYFGFGYWALVAREFSRAIFMVIGTWVACPWVPDMPNRQVKIKHLIDFGRNVTGFNLVHFFSRSIDKILIGKFHGASWVGIYTNSHHLIAQPVSQVQFPVNTVALPVLSSIQGDPQQFRAYYENMIQFVLFVSMPVVVFLGIFADVIIHLLLGPQWLGAIPIFQILAVGAFIEPIVHTTGPPMIAIGKTKEYFKLGLINSISLIVFVVLGSFWGTPGVAWGYSAGMYCAFIACMVYGLRQSPVKITPVLLKIATTAFCTIITGLSVIYFRYLFGWNMNLIAFFAFLLSGTFLYFSLWSIMPGGRLLLRNYMTFSKSVFKR